MMDQQTFQLFRLKIPTRKTLLSNSHDFEKTQKLVKTSAAFSNFVTLQSLFPATDSINHVLNFIPHTIFHKLFFTK